MNNTITFWQLIEGNKIEIPVIQRDYAQGREEDKVNNIRKELVIDLVNSLEKKDKSKDKSLHLGFVYGKIEGKEKQLERERNKRAIENILNAVQGYAEQLEMRITTDISILSNGKSDSVNLPTFYPLDGQQRLTTLFLLHWYLVAFSNHQDSETYIKILNNFSYKTRKSSLDFCSALTHYDNVKDLKLLKGVLSESIQNQKWFRKIWTRDSTVRGMLVMLDEIHDNLSIRTGIEDKLNLLISKSSSISFDFLDLNELNQTDELYVKMNARGKQLSEFEHFKAWLQNYVSIKKFNVIKGETENEIVVNDLIEDKEWKLKIDRVWLDLFWKNKETGIYNVDNVIYHAFKQISLFAYISNKGKLVDEEVTKTVRENSYIPFSFFEKHDFVNAETLNFLFNTLNVLCDKEKLSHYEAWLHDITAESFFGFKLDLSKFYLKNDRTIDRPETVFYYSFLQFLNSSKNNESEENFKDWMRFTRNIIFNTYIQNPENFIDAILSLNELKSHIDSISLHITSQTTKIPFFGDAVKQEVLKFNLMKLNGWREAIIKCENHLYFKGDIGFLLEMSKVEDTPNLEKFHSYAQKASVLFDDRIQNHPDKLLQRALLTKGDFLPGVGANYLIPLSNRESLRARRDNWQRVFNNVKYRNILKTLLDNLTTNDTDIECQLLKLINNYSEGDWKYYFIKSISTVDYCTQGFIRYTDVNDILLLKTSRVYGNHAELRSYYLYTEHGIENIKPFEKKEYWSNKMSQYSFPCIRFSDWDYEGLSYRLEIAFISDDEKYLLQIVNKENLKISEKICDLLLAANWQLNNEGTQCFFSISGDAEISLQIISTLDILSTLC